MRYILIAALVATALAATSASAQVPRTINYQGVLTDAGGIAVPDSDYNMTFKIYDVAEEGTELWVEYQLVPVASGIFNVILGSDAVLALPFDEPYWLGIAVEGEAELSPRIPLAAAAYSMSATSMFGSANVFPSDGHVGIGTLSPSSALEVISSDAVVIRANSSNSNWASVYVNGSTSGHPMYGYMRQNILRGYHYVTGGYDWILTLDGDETFRVGQDGRVSTGGAAVVEGLNVNGAINIGTTAGNSAGTIRWTGADFEGYDGGAWKSLTSGGSGSLPAGSQWQTLRHDGVSWAASDLLINNGSRIGVGGVPNAMLDVHGTDFRYMLRSTADGGAGASLYLDSDTRDWILWGSNSAGYIGGDKFSIRDHSIPAERLTIDGAGNTGIGKPSPVKRLDVAGSIRADDSLFADALELGNDTAGSLRIMDEAGGPVLAQFPTLGGCVIRAYSETGATQLYFGPDLNGEGGFLRIYSDETESSSFYVDGNYNGTSNPYMVLYGPTNSLGLNMSATGNASVALPPNAVDQFEILGEPGVASATLETSVSLTSDPTVVMSRTISAPSAGYVLVIGTVQTAMTHTNGVLSSVDIAVSDDSAVIPPNQDVAFTLPNGAPSGTYHVPVTVQGLFEVTQGSHTFYLLGEEYSATTASCMDAQLSLLFVPTGYGTVTPTLASGVNVPDDRARTTSVTSADIAAERSRSIADNEARIERELREMRERIAELERSIQDNR